jgi:hypothetical protein
VSFIDWLIYSPRGEVARISAGISILAILALVDLYRRREEATRWREYAFLLFTVFIAIIYGILNDQLTSRISWEYFYYGKGLDAVLGPHLPPDPRELSWEAAKVGMKATWAVGLLVGVTCLLANNPHPSRPQLSYPKLLTRTIWPLALACAFAVLLGAAGHHGTLAFLSEDFREMLQRNEFRPRRFMTVYGIHLGGYIGGAIGAILAVLSIRRARRNLTAAPP